jgi:predicted ATPase/DNA-binding CsgD family transcriptional regulator
VTEADRRHDLTSFVGREREIAAVQRLLAETHLLTLTGPGGVGKTRLTLAAATGATDLFPDGVHVVTLAALADPSLVLPAIAAALGIREVAGQSPIERLAGHLRSKRALLVLDNFEPVLAAAGDVAGLLAAGPAVRALVTSREPLHVAGEQRFPVPPLALPPDSMHTTDLAALGRCEAVALFVARTRAVDPFFALTTANAAVVVEACRRLEGLPLALELAAARMNVLTPETLLAHLDPRLPLLTGGPLDAPRRHRTLEAAIAWSYDLLAPSERTLLTHLAVFAGGCMLEAAEAVCGPAAGAFGPPAVAVLDGLGSLLDKSLLQRTKQPDGHPRFRMLETIREFALERLEASGGAAAVRERHAAFYRALAETAAPELLQPGQAACLDRLEPERHDLDAALEWYSTREPVTGLRMTTQLAPLWRLRGPFQTGWGWLRRALTAAPDAPAGLRALALQQAGELAFRLGDHVAASRSLEEAVIRWRDAGLDTDAAHSLHLLGTLAHRHEDYPRAVALYEEALEVWRAADDRWGIAISLHTLGVVADERGDSSRAAALYEEALEVWRDTADTMGVAVSLDALGGLARARGDYARAAALYEEALALKRRLGDQLAIAFSLDHLGALARAQSEYARATVLHEEALVLKRQLGEERLVEFSLYNLCLAAYQAGQRARARALGCEALTLCVKAGKIADAARRIEGIADVVVVDSSIGAATLLGAAAALRTAHSIAPRDPAAHERRVAAVRTTLPAPLFVAAWAAGLSMTPEWAIAHALAWTGEEECATPTSGRLSASAEPASVPSSPPLTAREQEVAALVARGDSNREIARALGISERTAENHVKHVRTKLGVRSRAAVASWAAEHGLSAGPQRPPCRSACA